MAFIRNTSKDLKKGITYGEVLDRYVLLEKVKDLPGDKLCFARRKNLMHLRTFEKFNSIHARIPMSEEYQKYQQSFSELRSKFLLTDRDGKTIMQFNGSENVPLVDVANAVLIARLDELKFSFKSAISEREDDIKAYTDFMDEVVPAEELPPVHEVKIGDASGLSQDQVDAIYWFIKETD